LAHFAELLIRRHFSMIAFRLLYTISLMETKHFNFFFKKTNQ